MSPGKRSGGVRRVTGRVVMMLVGLLAADQVLQHTVLADGFFLRTRVAPFSPPLFSARQIAFFESYEDWLANDRARFDGLTMFDPELGWCPRPGQVIGDEVYDWAGSRVGTAPLPRERAAGERLIALVGCSFTLGSEVRGEETWAAALEGRLAGTRIGNFGVGATGPDQALLRYRRDVVPLAPDEVWYGWFPQASLRATSRFPALYERWRARMIVFKPSFTLDGAGALVPHPSPAATPQEVIRLIRDPRAFLDAVGSEDPWIARAPAAFQPPGTRWEHRSGLARLLLSWREAGGRDVGPPLEDGTSALFRLTHALIGTLAREARANGARFRVVVLPAAREIEALRETGGGYWLPLAERLRADGIEVIDLTPAFVDAGVELDGGWWMPGAHYSPRTNELAAEVLAAALDG